MLSVFEFVHAAAQHAGTCLLRGLLQSVTQSSLIVAVCDVTQSSFRGFCLSHYVYKVCISVVAAAGDRA